MTEIVERCEREPCIQYIIGSRHQFGHANYHLKRMISSPQNRNNTLVDNHLIVEFVLLW